MTPARATIAPRTANAWTASAGRAGVDASGSRGPGQVGRRDAGRRPARSRRPRDRRAAAASPRAVAAARCERRCDGGGAGPGTAPALAVGAARRHRRGARPGRRAQGLQSGEEGLVTAVRHRSVRMTASHGRGVRTDPANGIRQARFRQISTASAPNLHMDAGTMVLRSPYETLRKGGSHGQRVDGGRELSQLSPAEVLPQRRGRGRRRPQDLCHLPGPGAVPRVRARRAHRSRRVGWLLRAGAPPHRQARRVAATAAAS